MKREVWFRSGTLPVFCSLCVHEIFGGRQETYSAFCYEAQTQRKGAVWFVKPDHGRIARLRMKDTRIDAEVGV